MPLTLSAQLEKAQRKAQKATARVKDLEAEVADLRERVAIAEQAAADQHSAMMRQDHVHAQELAAIHAPLTAINARLPGA